MIYTITISENTSSGHLFATLDIHFIEDITQHLCIPIRLGPTLMMIGRQNINFVCSA